ncbi:septation protein A [Ferrimonas aestuarii]|uniref:Inner membrane-spanning protein YciB n=1 Tax=Ferrimonas aestuarii TaxID=2569539 RepID=A0A4U1BTB6_9GAMM|nr:septation protein A [Ferrimonas aestuarii]TKB58432.1 septation protein A [Ferrimonas aestuarii]
MKQILDFLPLLVFFAVYKFYDIYLASGALVAASAIQIGLLYTLYKKVEKQHIITFILVAVFGTLTMVLRDDTFIKWKVTIVQFLFAGALLVAELMKKSLLKAMLGKEMPLPDNIWRNAALAWVVFFIGSGLLNIYIAFNLSQEAWVNFKVFGLMGMTLVYTVLTIVYLYRHLPEEFKNKK